MTAPQERRHARCARPEAVAVLAEARIKDRLQYLQQRLLDQTVRYRRNTELTLAISPGLEIVTVVPDWAGTSRNSCSRITGTPCAGVPRSGQCPDRRRQLRLCWLAPVSAPLKFSLVSRHQQR